MRLGKTTSVEELQVVSRFESLRKILFSEAYADHLGQAAGLLGLADGSPPAVGVAGPNARDLLNTPFVDLSATPGIGRKKIASFVSLLARAANTDPAELPDRHPRVLHDGTPRHSRRRGKRRQRQRLRSDRDLRSHVGTMAGEHRPPRSGAARPSAVSRPACKT